MVDLVEFGKKSTWIDLIEELVMPLTHRKGRTEVSIETIKNKIAEELSADDVVFIKEAFRLKGIKVTPSIDGDSNEKYLEFTKMKRVK